MDLMKLRFTLAVTALVSIVAAFALVLFFGQGVTTVQVALLAPLAMALISEAKSSSAFIFDGVPTEPDTKSTTVTEVTPPATPILPTVPAAPVKTQEATPP
jgi:hypothetical protein